MPENKNIGQKPRLLVFNCHESWVHQLSYLDGFHLDIIVGLPGIRKQNWDTQMRPVPSNARLISLKDAQNSVERYHCIIAHNITDLLDVKFRPEPRILVLHSTLEGRAKKENCDIPPEKFKQAVRRYTDLTGAHLVAISQLKADAWGFVDDIVPCGVEPEEYCSFTGEEARGLRVSNFINDRREILLWDFHERAFEGVNVRLVGHNPDMPGVKASDNWQDLKNLLRSHRFFIHTANPRFEDGYNLATLEAMAAGMPVLGNNHPTSPVEHNVSGFLSDDPGELREYAWKLLDDRELAVKMGKKARQTVEQKYHISKFAGSFSNSIKKAAAKSSNRKADLSQPVA